jgi:hypothetical protein
VGRSSVVPLPSAPEVFRAQRFALLSSSTSCFCSSPVSSHSIDFPNSRLIFGPPPLFTSPRARFESLYKWLYEFPFHPRLLFPRVGFSVAAAISSRTQRSSRNSICLLRDRCSRSARTASFAFRLADMRKGRRILGSLIGSTMTNTPPFLA